MQYEEKEQELYSQQELIEQQQAQMEAQQKQLDNIIGIRGELIDELQHVVIDLLETNVEIRMRLGRDRAERDGTVRGAFVFDYAPPDDRVAGIDTEDDQKLSSFFDRLRSPRIDIFVNHSEPQHRLS